MNITLGSDPEFFLQDTGTNFIVSSQTARVPGSKHKPKAMPMGFIHPDNVLLELNVPPASSEDEWVFNHQETLRLAQLEISNNYKVDISASVEMEPMELWHPDARVFGCEPDFNAWHDGDVNPPPSAASPLLRTAGGHIHIGIDPVPSPDVLREIVKACDVFLGLPSLLLDHDNRRRELYGQAGAHRLKPYGVEYRVLSNFWLRDEAHMRWAYRNTLRAIDHVCGQGKSYTYHSQVASILNTGDRNAALEIMAILGLDWEVK